MRSRREKLASSFFDREKGGAELKWIIAIFILLTLIIIGGMIAAGIFAYLKFGEWAPKTKTSTSTSIVSGSCSLQDAAFINSSAISEDLLISKLEQRYPILNQTEQKKALDTIFAQSKKAEINPAILVAFWGAEQSFKNPSQAFGCGNTSDGSSGATGIEAETACAINLVKRVISTGNGAISSYNPGGKAATDWSTPNGADRWTRLLFHYVMGGKLGSGISTEGNSNYKLYGYVSNADSPRIKFLNMLIPELVTCVSNSKGTSSNIIASIAQGEVGTKETTKNGKSDCTKYHLNDQVICEDWCADFVSWVYRKAGYDLNKSSVDELYSFFGDKTNGHKLLIGDSLKVKDISEGDVVFYKTHSHTGIVTGVHDKIINIVAGNSNNAVSPESPSIADLKAVGKW